MPACPASLWWDYHPQVRLSPNPNHPISEPFPISESSPISPRSGAKVDRQTERPVRLGSQSLPEVDGCLAAWRAQIAASAWVAGELVQLVQVLSASCVETPGCAVRGPPQA